MVELKNELKFENGMLNLWPEYGLSYLILHHTKLDNGTDFERYFVSTPLGVVLC